MRSKCLLLSVACLLLVLLFQPRAATALPWTSAGPALSAQASAGPAAGVFQAPARDAGDPAADFWAKVRLFLWIFFILSLIALVALVGTAIFLLWQAKRMVAKALEPDLPKLERLVAKIRSAHPALDDSALARKIIQRQASRSGLVGLVTGIGGLPVLPIAIPIDIAMTVKLQSNLVHMLRIVHSGGHSAEEVSEASLWLITTGGQELTAASSTLVRDLLVKYLSTSLLKFLPILGGLVGFALNWGATQALGRLSLRWLDREPGAKEVLSPAGGAQD